jgi:hypothetical protein
LQSRCCGSRRFWPWACVACCPSQRLVCVSLSGRPRCLCIMRALRLRRRSRRHSTMRRRCRSWLRWASLLLLLRDARALVGSCGTCWHSQTARILPISDLTNRWLFIQGAQSNTPTDAHAKRPSPKAQKLNHANHRQTTHIKTQHTVQKTTYGRRRRPCKTRTQLIETDTWGKRIMSAASPRGKGMTD